MARIAQSYKELIVWQKAMELVVAVYDSTRAFPKEEQYTLTSQIRRSALSVPSNIAEGSRRSTRRDYRSFLVNAYGSASELETQIEIAKRLPWGSAIEFGRVDTLLDEVLRMLNRMTSELKDSTTYNL